MQLRNREAERRADRQAGWVTWLAWHATTRGGDSSQLWLARVPLPSPIPPPRLLRGETFFSSRGILLGRRLPLGRDLDRVGGEESRRISPRSGDHGDHEEEGKDGPISHPGEMSALRKLKRRFVLETRPDDNFIKGRRPILFPEDLLSRRVERHRAVDIALTRDDANFNGRRISFQEILLDLSPIEERREFHLYKASYI